MKKSGDGKLVFLVLKEQLTFNPVFKSIAGYVHSFFVLI